MRGRTPLRVSDISPGKCRAAVTLVGHSMPTLREHTAGLVTSRHRVMFVIIAARDLNQGTCAGASCIRCLWDGGPHFCAWTASNRSMMSVFLAVIALAILPPDILFNVLVVVSTSAPFSIPATSIGTTAQTAVISVPIASAGEVGTALSTGS